MTSLDSDIVAARWQESSLVGLWSVTTDLKIGEMPLAEFALAYPAHSGSIADTDDQAPKILRADNFEISMKEGVLQVAHHDRGHVE